jgi:hypothetical protein
MVPIAQISQRSMDADIEELLDELSGVHRV